MATKKKPSKKRTKRDHYQEITDRVIAALESGETAPWQRPWTASPLGSAPRNAATGATYRGVNVLLTLLTQWERGYDYPLWLSFKQADEIAAKAMRKAGRKVEQNNRKLWIFAEGEEKGKSVGGIRKGQNKENKSGATDVIFWKPMTKVNDDGEESSWMLMRSYSVFNVVQCDQHVIDYVAPKTPEEMVVFSPAEEICEKYEVETCHGGDRAFYSPPRDMIQLPNREQFNSSAHYYTTRFHEMGHSTGHASRLSRDGITKGNFKGSHEYAEEELVAEFAACFLAGEAGIERTIEKNSASYLKLWASKLREDKKIIVRASQRAQKAADYILGKPAFVQKEVI